MADIDVKNETKVVPKPEDLDLPKVGKVLICELFDRQEYERRVERGDGSELETTGCGSEVELAVLFPFAQEFEPKVDRLSVEMVVEAAGASGEPSVAKLDPEEILPGSTAAQVIHFGRNVRHEGDLRRHYTATHVLERAQPRDPAAQGLGVPLRLQLLEGDCERLLRFLKDGGTVSGDTEEALAAELRRLEAYRDRIQDKLYKRLDDLLTADDRDELALRQRRREGVRVNIQLDRLRELKRLESVINTRESGVQEVQ